MKKEDVSAGITAFIDILGFSNKVSSANTFDDIAILHKGIATIQEYFEFSNVSEMTAEVHELAGKRVLAFLDCVVINIPLESDSTEYSGSFDPMMMELLGMAISQSLCVHSSLFIRGGIDIGWWYNNGDILISSGLVNSAKREESANVPVIALCEDLYNYFLNHEDRNTYHESIDPIRSMFRYYSDDQADYYYLDYIDVTLRNIDWCPRGDEKEEYFSASEEGKDKMRARGHKEMIERWLKGHAEIIESAAKEVKKSKKIHSKYEWLAQYHNDVAKGYTEEKSCFCNVKSHS